MLKSWDDRRDYIILPTLQEAIAFAAEHWIHSAERAIQQRGRFMVALSGGSTPKAIFAKIRTMPQLDWTKIWLFWSDERAVPPDHPDSNYHMAMTHGLQELVPPAQIFRMRAEKEIEKNAREYEEIITRHLDKHLFDLVMLGVGEDGHTASLFPNSDALKESKRLVTAAIKPEDRSSRMTLTFPCINASAHIAVYALGPSKRDIVSKALDAAIDSPYPASRLGTPEHKALWILDADAAARLNNP